MDYTFSRMVEKAKKPSPVSPLPPALQRPLPSLLMLWIYLLMASSIALTYLASVAQSELTAVIPCCSSISSVYLVQTCRVGARRLALFTLLTGVLLSFQMISVTITSAHHPTLHIQQTLGILQPRDIFVTRPKQ